MKLPIQASVSPYKSKGIRTIEIRKRDGKICLCQYDGATDHSKRDVYYPSLAQALKECQQIWGIKPQQWEHL